MGTIGLVCVIAGLVILVLLVIVGFVLAHSIVGMQMVMSLLQLTPALTYLVFIGGFLLVGLLIGAGLVMNGLIYDRLEKLYRLEKKKRRAPTE